MFTCLQCGKVTSLPVCEYCGCAFEVSDGVYQLTRDPNANLDDVKAAKYIGYDRIGAYYHGKGWADSRCTPADLAVGKRLAELIGRGLLLDLGCGGGTFAVPAALHGCTVVAGDISNVMLRLLLRKAAASRAAPDRIIACRMNALSIPLADASVDGVVANSLLHLISEPARVIAEMHRVLRPGGRLVLGVNSPGLPEERRQALRHEDREYLRRESAFHRRYWELLNELGVHATRHSWRFDQFAACDAAFGNSTRVEIDFSERTVSTLADYFLYRMGGKGFSDQQGVPDELHEKVFARVVEEFEQAHGEDFDAVTFVSITDGLTLQVFEK